MSLWFWSVLCFVLASLVVVSGMTPVGDRLMAHYEKGEETKKVPKDKVPERLLDHFDHLVNWTKDWDDAPGLVQEALLWDNGYVLIGNVYDEILLRCEWDVTMSTIQISLEEYTSRCNATQNTVRCGDYYKQHVCDGRHLSEVVKCGTRTTEDYEQHGYMYYNDGSDSQIPQPELRAHSYTEGDISWTVYAIHLQDDGAYEDCPQPLDEPVIPCAKISDMDSSIRWCSPSSSTKINDFVSNWALKAANEGSDSWIYILVACIAVAVILVLIFLWYRRRKRQQAMHYGDLLELDATASRDVDWRRGNTLSTTPLQESNSGQMSMASSNRWGKMTQGTNEIGIELGSADLVDSNKIEILQVLGSGTYGEVYKGRFSGAFIAIKKVHAWKCEADKEEFKQEIQLLKTIHHPNIIQFIGVAVFPDKGLCVMLEFMERGDLFTVLQDTALKLTWNVEKLRIAKDCICGLVYLHDFDPPIAHRDLKSRNLLIGSSFQAKLADFGTCREVQSATMTLTGSALWMAPEVARGERYSEKADIFSFGVMLTELDTHQLPYHDVKADDGSKLAPLAVTHRVITGGLRPTLTNSCPSRIRKLMMICTREKPQDRPDATEVLDFLYDLESEMGQDNLTGTYTF